MMLYVREMVEEYAFKKWNGPEGLDAEYERREAQKKDKKDKKFKEKLADLRRRTMTSTWERKRQEGPHKHEFDASVEDEDGNTTQTCKTCGLVIESEEFWEAPLKKGGKVQCFSRHPHQASCISLKYTADFPA